jgi:hypothetical protein
MNIFRRCRSWWAKSFLVLEFWSAVFVTSGFVLWVEICNGAIYLDGILHSNRGAIYGALASIFGSLLGFLSQPLRLSLVFQMPSL